MSNPTVRLCLVLHNHQPIGNFENVFEEAYQDSYLPFLELFEPYEKLKISLHTSGPLMEWLARVHPEYLDRVARLVADGRVEIVGGAFYEPILTMIPSRDRRGQITSFSDWLNQRLHASIQGMWIPERVWEAGLTSDLAAADIQYTVLDDHHFFEAGLVADQLHGYYVTEDEGRLLKIFPGSERLRYLIPFCEPHETINFMRALAEQRPGSVAVFGDDGEKFGTWPNTKEHVYRNGWLKNFFDQLTAESEWLSTTTLADAVQNTPPVGKVYLPDASYREMTEWAMPVTRQVAFEELVHALENHESWESVKPWLKGGFWRNFKVKYPETNEMYARMMYVSTLIQQAEQEGGNPQTIAAARDLLYRGQCNCSYWHGAFGGVYLPHLRNAVYENLIKAEKTIDATTRQDGKWVEAFADDYDFDGHQEIRLGNEQMIAWIAPHIGGQIYELDLLKQNHNLLATIQRRPEAYHGKILRGANQDAEQAASIHDRVVFKQEGLDQHLGYDQQMRKMLIDRFWEGNVAPGDAISGKPYDQGDFANAPWQATIRRKPNRIQVMLEREAMACGISVKVTRIIALSSDSDLLEVGYRIEGLPPGKEINFGVELQFAGMPDGQSDRYFESSSGERLGTLGESLDLDSVDGLRLIDEWLNIRVELGFDRPTHLWAWPVRSVSQSESGFELVHQSVAVQPWWLVKGDDNGCWSTQISLGLGCTVPVG